MIYLQALRPRSQLGCGQVLRESSGRRRRAGHHAQGPRRLLLGPRRGADADLQRVLIRAGALGGNPYGLER